jgi:phosphatidylglycerol lysyltransferase
VDLAAPAAVTIVSERVSRTLPALIGLVCFIAALVVLNRELDSLTWAALSADIVRRSPWQITAAVVLTAINYAVLTGYDFIALEYIGRRLPRLRVAMTSFIAYAVANNVGLSVLSGVSVRYRFYARWGVTGEELSRMVFSYSVTLWLGLMLLGGLSLALSPPATAYQLPFSLAIPMGWTLVALSGGYVVMAWAHTGPIRLWAFELPQPTVRLALAQIVISVVDWLLAGAVLFVLLPEQSAPFLVVLGAFLTAQIIGLVSHVPGGVGVFEGTMVLLLKPFMSSAELLPSLVAYRAIYYLMPLVVALVALVADAAHLRRHYLSRAQAYLGDMAEQLMPRLLALVTFVGGAVLLFSGATPASVGRLTWLDRILPLGVIETSHFVGSIAGAVLLLLSQGIARRLDAAYYFTTITLTAGVVASILKGGDWEEAAALTGVLLVLWRARPAFDRKAAFFATRFSSGWAAAVAAALIASIWLGFFAFKHVDYSNELWWQFALHAEASRFLRGSVGAATVVLLFAVSRLMGHAPHEIEIPSDDDLRDAGRVIAMQEETYPNLAFLRDKALLFDAPRQGFLMYGVQGRTWVALGDPVGPWSSTSALIRLFLERCDDFGGTPVMYQVASRYLHYYADFGFTFVKLGEQARVDLEGFSLDGGSAAKHRQILHRLDREGHAFRIVPVNDVVALLPQLQEVSDEWLASKAVAEKGFSLGFFDRDYLARFPLAVIEHDGRIEAFANVWPGSKGEELSVDLIRYRSDAPPNVMDALFTHLMLWGKQEHFRSFLLGMAPMSGFEESPVAPFWTRAGLFLYEHGESLYQFQGLRAYKEKFHPTWEPLYLAYPGGLRLPRVLADVSVLIAGGYRRIFTK